MLEILRMLWAVLRGWLRKSGPTPRKEDIAPMTEPELISNVQTLISETRTLRKSVQELAARSVRSERDIRRSKWNIRVVALIAILGLAIGGVVFAVRSEGQQRQITRQAVELAQVVYTQCATQDASNARQAALIDTAIAAERRRPRPDPKRIADLEKFRPNRLDCGKKP